MSCMGVVGRFGLPTRAARRFRFKLNKSLYLSDRAQSGTSLFDRPGLTRQLLGASAKHEFDIVLAEATDRLSRSQADLFWLADCFRFDSVKIFTPAGRGQRNAIDLL